jgi:Ran GTPase-activating protein (RanGAP) involved in mRNA processing and transport
VTAIDLEDNRIGAEGALMLADALKVNTSVTTIDIGHNTIGDEGASALADALIVNTSLTSIDLRKNEIGNEGAATLADALKVNTSVTDIDLDYNEIDETNRASINALFARNKRLRCLFLFDARQMLLSLMGGCADECSVVWPYLLESDDTDGTRARRCDSC